MRGDIPEFLRRDAKSNIEHAWSKELEVDMNRKEHSFSSGVFTGVLITAVVLITLFHYFILPHLPI